MRNKVILAIVIVAFTFLNCGKDKDVTEDSFGNNEDINLGLISEPNYTTNGSFILKPKEAEYIDDNLYTYSAAQRFLFSVNAYSKFKISVQNYNGHLSLVNITTNEILTLQFRDSFLSFWGDEPYETELDEGEYALQISGNGAEVTYEIQIENIDELRPYKDLGVLSLPYNQHFTFDEERERRTVYDFEIQEETDWKIYGATDPYSPEKAVILYDSEGKILFSLQDSYTFPEPINIPLQKGKYSLSFFTEMNLILGDNEFGDQDFGEILTLPYSQEYTINFNFDTNRTQRTSFQTTVPSAINLSYSIFGSHSFALFKADGTLMVLNWYWANSDTLPAGSYYIESSPIGSPYRDDSGDSQPYTPFLIGTYNLELNELE